MHHGVGVFHRFSQLVETGEKIGSNADQEKGLGIAFRADVTGADLLDRPGLATDNASSRPPSSLHLHAASCMDVGSVYVAAHQHVASGLYMGVLDIFGLYIFPRQYPRRPPHNALSDAYTAAGFYPGIANDLAALGRACMTLDKNREAAGYLKRSVKIYALTGDRVRLDAVLKDLAAVSEKEQIDLTLTTYFVKQWIEKKYQKSPCD